ncbi:MerR family transcriptional regulator [Anaerofustis stercorihominis]|uniref:MerR family transcriptional regulator n=1 Tax=Anaerofustis stercorihominis TaxID=214853 RepID=UPI003983FB5B
MKLKVGDVSKLFGISVRTLHYYDEIDLLRPRETDEISGYRYYDKDDLEQLQEIMFYKKLLIPLKEIKLILSKTDYEREEILSKHKNLLLLEKEKIDSLIKLVDNTLKGENIDMSTFDMNEIERVKKEYKQEVIARWGSSEAYKESEKRTNSYSKDDWEKINKKQEEIFTLFYLSKDKDVNSDEVKKLVKTWQNFISDNFYPCTDEILSGLADMYVCDDRFRNNIDKFGEGTAEFMSKAIKAYTK